MKVIESKYGGRPTTVELEGNEPRIRDMFERLLDEGWDIGTALRYAERRFGVATAAFRGWLS